ncbi:phage portal protein [Mucisphaera calidilacus]|uniref:Phage portal protein, SPP1 Gp6-like n=1 Tax=Mucisphaera calidilacus TaxID=2527982 RepID=A0A518C0P4_9BACT|nr:phage portal protein [Mucisphaera calidilacus]QDU72803.1 Phage portal protein, SPP1 Gp6-like [Mucisphaera calidilacus]
MGPKRFDVDVLARRVAEHAEGREPWLRRLWAYYRNPVTPVEGPGGLRHRSAQEVGLPERLRSGQREVVTENDIAWRLHALVDFMFGKPVVIRSEAGSAGCRVFVERFLGSLFERSGGVGFFQNMALLGSVYGYVDVLVRVDDATRGGGGDSPESLAGRLRLELAEAPRAVPTTDERDYRRLAGYAVRCRVGGGGGEGGVTERVEAWTSSGYGRFERVGEKGSLAEVASAENVLGRVPVVHIQNLAQPLRYAGLSDVEPLIPLQDELNTRLSDRANRVTFQSFRMYLGKGIDRFTERPVGPGQMWSTDNPEASIESFGGDASSPSEEAHLSEVRDAMDKTSGVTPIAAGLIRGKVGNLTSENALRVILMGTLAKTDKKRVTYGDGLERVCELALHAADVLGWYRTETGDRRVRLEWPNVLPQSTSQVLSEARVKAELGVPRERLLDELGYGAGPGLGNGMSKHQEVTGG